jgi:hypothetical protein
MGLLFSRTVTRLPLLEPLGFRLAGAENQRVEAGFVDDDVTVRNTSPWITIRITEVVPLIFIQQANALSGVRIILLIVQGMFLIIQKLRA